jgi:hypothetical protein
VQYVQGRLLVTSKSLQLEIYSLTGCATGAPVACIELPSRDRWQGPEVHLSDCSTGIPSWWLWRFGDGTISNAPNPDHTYELPGKKGVSVTVGNDYGYSTTQLTVNVGSASRRGTRRK